VNVNRDLKGRFVPPVSITIVPEKYLSTGGTLTRVIEEKSSSIFPRESEK